MADTINNFRDHNVTIVDGSDAVSVIDVGGVGALATVPAGVTGVSDLKIQDKATGSGAIAESIPVTAPAEKVQLTLHLDAAPTTSENFTVTINSVNGAAYDTVIVKEDLSTASITDLKYIEVIDLKTGDTIDVAYTNTDAATWGLEWSLTVTTV